MLGNISKSKMFMLFGIILLAFFSVSLTSKTVANDTFYNIKTGEQIVKNGIDMKDHFSWHENLEYTYPHWAFDVGIYFIYNAFGFDGTYVLTCILSIILAMTILVINLKLCKIKLLSFVVSFFTMYFIRNYLVTRAHLVTFILFALTIYFIEQFLKTKKKGYVVCLIIIPIIIANVHAAVFPVYFVLYLPYLAEYYVSLFLKKRKYHNNSRIIINENPNSKYLIIIMLISFFGGLITPIDLTPYTYLIKTLMGNQALFITEHFPIVLTQHHDAFFLIICLVFLLFNRNTKIRLTDLLMLGGLSLLMISYRRQITLFVVICCIIYNRLLQNISIKNKYQYIIISLLIIVALITSIDYAKFNFNEEYVDKTIYPVEAAEYLKNNVDLEKAHIFNDYEEGSYLLFKDIPVFIDTRCDLYNPEFNNLKSDIFIDYMLTSNLSYYYKDIFNKYQITHYITNKETSLNKLIIKSGDQSFKNVYEDDNFIIYEVKVSENNEEKI